MKAEQYPKGSLNLRKKRYKGREYAYHYLVAREEGRVVNRHIPEAELPVLQRRLAERDKCRKEMQAQRIAKATKRGIAQSRDAVAFPLQRLFS